MTHSRTTILALTVACALSMGPTADAVAGPESVAASVTFTDLHPDHQKIALCAAGLFAEAGLELPPIDFRGHTGLEGCFGRAGSHQREGDRSTIDICTDTTGAFSTWILYLHEMSHAWAEHRLSPERKAAFQELRGWEHWRDYDAADWHENGTEQAAEIMVWGLIDRPWHCMRIFQNTCEDLHEGYVTLTGLAPLHGYTDQCESRDGEAPPSQV